MGATAGALLGTATGLVIGKTTSASTRKSMLIGAGLGALAGGGVGLYMDNQESKLRARLQGTGVSVTRVGDDIILNMPSNITFDTDQSAMKPQFYDTLNSVAIVLREFNKTLDRRHRPHRFDRHPAAQPAPLRGRAPDRWRIISSHRATTRSASRCIGMGQNDPIATNATPEGAPRTGAWRSRSFR